MKREEWTLESSHFTTVSALVREISAWLEFSDCKLIVRVEPKQIEQLQVEIEGWRTLGRVKVETK